MLAFYEDPTLKAFVLDTLAAHCEADKLIHGTYWENGKGCAVGCTLEAVRLRQGLPQINHRSHALYESALGIPQILARLEDSLFESLPTEDSQRWPERFIDAIRPGADLTLIWPRFALWLLADELPQYTKGFPKSTAALAEVAGLYREWCETQKNPARARWLSACQNAAATAAATYPYAAAYATTAAAYAAAYAAATYAYAATAAATATATATTHAHAAAYAAARRRQANKLVELLSAA